MYPDYRMAVTVVNDNDFDEKVLKSDKPVLVDFWAPWCGPCRMAEPVLDELSEDYGDKVVFLKINVDENQDRPGEFGVMSIPTTILYKNGEEVGRRVGFAGRQGFEDLIKQVI